ncbi:hypothetical protein LNP74_20640 [Klebsiella pneumoniae subsp. pneumoniae]|nr:hypothetical protein [Klebsiella pneumoniae subsp. pneumoniae]
MSRALADDYFDYGECWSLLTRSSKLRSALLPNPAASSRGLASCHRGG